MSLFITFEGGEGCGKSTQANILSERLKKQKKWGVLYLEEPGTTLLGKHIRECLKVRIAP
jgi:dTMP kinase